MAPIGMDLSAPPVRDALPVLLLDRSTKRNIIFATESYAELGDCFGATDEMTVETVLSLDIKPRALKAAEEQALRTRRRAEVFTPAWVCGMMNDHADEVWFGRPGVFGSLDGGVWTASSGRVEFPEGKSWRRYVDARRLEITCGEAPYLVSRYDMGTGEPVPAGSRLGMLDRKLRIVSENADSQAELLKWALRALQSVYGYEYQGDNLLIARVNLFMTYADFIKSHLGRDASKKELREAARVITWNLWQMDGLKGTVPNGALYEKEHQISLFEMLGQSPQADAPESVACRIFDWRGHAIVEFNSFREGRNGSMKFDFIIGNPPYQEETLGDNKGFAPSIYDKFMDATYDVADKVELIHPARFLFNAGSTLKAWNEKMLNDSHLKVLHYESDAGSIFPGVDIKGGVVVTYHDQKRDFGAIGTFTKFPELNMILDKVKRMNVLGWIDSIIYIQNRFDLGVLLGEHPDFKSSIGSDGKDSRFEKNIFLKIPIFVEDEKFESDIHTIGIYQNKRTWRYIEDRYVDKNHENLFAYKVVIPVANGSGEFGQALSTPVVQKPREAYTRSFIGIGAFGSFDEALACEKYIKSKFARAMLHVLKVTQMANKDVWKCVPLQDFTSASDIDWTQSIANIDRQLYKKYGLSDEEITFIETHVKEMA